MVAIHAIYLEDGEIEALAEHGVRVSHNPSANMFLGDRAAKVHAMTKAGVCVALGTDGGLDNNSLSIFHEMKMTALVQKSLVGDPQAISARTIIDMATVNGGMITEWPIGILAPGHAADFIVLDLSDLAFVPGDRLESHMVYSISDRAIRHVYVQGKCLVHDGRLTRVDEQDLIGRVHATTRSFFCR